MSTNPAGFLALTQQVSGRLAELRTNTPDVMKSFGALGRAALAPGALDAKTKEMLYIAVSIAHGCPYCIHSHTAAARAKGMSEAERHEMIAIVGMAAETNRLVTALGVPVDREFEV